MVKQLNLFNQPSLNTNKALKDQMAQSYKECGLSMDEVLDRMNDLAGRYGVRLVRGRGQQLSKSSLEKWLNAQDMEHLPQPNSLVIFCAAIIDNRPMQVLCAPLGGAFIDAEEVKMLSWAKEYHRAKDARKRMKKLEAEL